LHDGRVPDALDEITWPRATDRLLLRRATAEDVGPSRVTRELDTVSRPAILADEWRRDR
jgi:hypothetical protein